MYIFKFLPVFSFADERHKKLFSDVVKHMLLKSIHLHSLNLLNFVCIVGFNVKTALENAKLAILGGLVLQIFFTPSQPWCSTDLLISPGKCWFIATHLRSLFSSRNNQFILELFLLEKMWVVF